MTTGTTLITPENLTKESLREILDDALIEASIDSDGDLLAEENGLRILLRTYPGVGAIVCSAVFRFREDADRVAKLVFVNRVNDEYRIARACVTKQDRLWFDHEISVEGGTTRRTIVCAIKAFAKIPTAAIQEYGQELVA